MHPYDAQALVRAEYARSWKEARREAGDIVTVISEGRGVIDQENAYKIGPGHVRQAGPRAPFYDPPCFPAYRNLGQRPEENRSRTAIPFALFLPPEDSGDHGPGQERAQNHKRNRTNGRATPSQLLAVGDSSQFSPLSRATTVLLIHVLTRTSDEAKARVPLASQSGRPTAPRPY